MRDECFESWDYIACQVAQGNRFTGYTPIDKDVNPFVVGGAAWQALHPVEAAQMAQTPRGTVISPTPVAVPGSVYDPAPSPSIVAAPASNQTALLVVGAIVLILMMKA